MMVGGAKGQDELTCLSFYKCRIAWLQVEKRRVYIKHRRLYEGVSYRRVDRVRLQVDTKAMESRKDNSEYTRTKQTTWPQTGT